MSELKPSPYNPRKDLKPEDPAYQKLKKSIVEFDYVDPIVWNQKSGRIVGGHQRAKILKELGINEVEVSVVDLDDTSEKALNLALNKDPGWDYPKLKNILLELDTGAFDIEITGFDENELKELFVDRMPPEEESDLPPDIAKREYQGETDFIENYFNHKNWIAQPAMFHLDDKKYTPDFFDNERNAWIEVAATRQAYHKNKEKYALFRKLYSKLTFEIRKPSGELLNEDSRDKDWED